MKINKPLVFLFVIFLALFVYANFFPLRTPDGDLSVFGLMSKYMITNGEIYYFYIGQHYNGAAATVSYLGIPFVYLFGLSSFAMHSLLLFIDILFFIVFYLIVSKLFDKKTAVICQLFFVFSTYTFLNSRLINPAYPISMMLNLLVFYLFYRAVVKQKHIKYAILLGLVSAIAHCALEFVLPLFFVLIVFWFITDNLFFKTKRFIVFLVSFLIGEIPLLIYNFTHGFANFKQLFAGSFIHQFICDTNLLPKTVDFGGRMVDHCKIFGDTRIKAPLSVSLSNAASFFGQGAEGKIYLLIFLGCLVVLFLMNFSIIKKIIIDLFRLKNTRISSRQSLELIMIIYIVLFFFSYALSGFSDTQHLLPVYPFFAILIGVSLSSLLNRQRFIAYLLILLLFTSSMISYVRIVNADDSENVDQVVNVLNENKIEFAYAEYFTQWKIIFQTDEKIIVSCNGLCPCGNRYPAYDKLVREQENPAIIMNDGSVLNDKLANYLMEANITFKSVNVQNKTIYFSFSRKVIPSDFVESCKYGDGLA